MIHADWGHLINNLFLLFPLVFFLTSYFGLWTIPSLGLAFGGLTNWLVLKTLPSDVTLLGISGVVYWLGAVWLTLYFLIERRFSWRHRLARVLFISLFLFVPEKYHPEVSYLSHLIGFVLGILCGLVIYFWRRQEFLNAEVAVLEAEEETPIVHREEALLIPRDFPVEESRA